MAAFTVIDHTELGAANAELVEITSIPSSYDHLYMVMSVRDDGASTSPTEFWMRVGNGSPDTGTNYSNTGLSANTATPDSGRNTGQTHTSFGLYSPQNSSTANTFGAVAVWIPNYANTSNYKQILSRSGCEAASTTNNYWKVAMGGHLWASTSAIDVVQVVTYDVGTWGDFMQYSTFTLYGVTGA